MSEFYVYDNSKADYTRIHRHDCDFCNDGKGTSGSAIGPADQFIACDTYPEANDRAHALGRPDCRPCKVCNPNVD